MKDEALENTKKKSGNAKGDVPRHDLKRSGGHDVLEVQGSVDRKDAPGAIEKEESKEERCHRGSSEYGCGQKREGGDVRFYVGGGEEGEYAESKAYWNIWCLPP